MDDEDQRGPEPDEPPDETTNQPSPAEWPLGLDADERSPEEAGYGYGV